MKNNILEYLKNNPEGKTPTEIGIALGKSCNSASSSVNLPLKKLIEEGFILREKINNKVIYRFKYPIESTNVDTRRSKEEVQAEIDWREKDIKELQGKVELNDFNKEYYLSRITHMTFAIEWCKWFLNEK